MQVIQEIKPGDVYRAFRVLPAYIYQLESSGKLPKRPKGAVTLEWLAGVTIWCEKARGSVPLEARGLIDRAFSKAVVRDE